MFSPPLLEYPAIASLAGKSQWICWRLEVGADGKERKFPQNPNNVLRLASVSDHTQWSSFAKACSAVIKHERLTGVGFVLTPDAGLIFVDIDDCIDEEGNVAPWAKNIVDTLDSFTEISPSGKGLHVFGLGVIPDAVRPAKSGATFKWGGWYDQARFFTVTGQHLKGTPEELREIGPRLEQITPVNEIKKTLGVKSGDARLDALIMVIRDAVHAKAEPPAEKLRVLLENVPAARESWEREKRGADVWTPSEWDLSLGSYLVQARWEPAEIAATLIAFRRRHGQDLKLRVDYYARTISKAMSDASQTRAQDALLVGDFHEIADEDARRAAVLEAVNAALFPTRTATKILRVMKFMSDPPVYKIISEAGQITGEAKMLLSQAACRGAIMDATNVVIPEFPRARWRAVVQNLLDASIIESMGAEATDIGFAAMLVQGYMKMRGRAIAPEADTDAALIEGNPFRKNGCVFIVGADLQKYAKVAHGNLTPRRIGTALKAAGCESETIGYTKENGARSTRGCWRVPEEFGGGE